MIYITSDLHFSHINILKYHSESRPFSSIQEMNETIVKNWNNKVSKEDITYILGDVFMGGSLALENNLKYLNALNGSKCLIIGNHDDKFLEHSEFIKCFDIVSYSEMLYYKDKIFTMTHKPPLNKIDDTIYYHLHGHTHSKPKLGNKLFDVGIDGSPDFSPYNLLDLLNLFEEYYERDY